MIELTAPNDTPLWIAKSWVQLVRHPLPAELREGVNAVVMMSGFNQGVTEDVATVVRALWNADG
jgi:hypothetical protein